mmetsp:Transcript_12352/g.22387  ORF Transcript_12352/g.22387 Transcript_12352/m.22387 type:complete len:577 (+) Transcript_12352:686-2416(+)
MKFFAAASIVAIVHGRKECTNANVQCVDNARAELANWNPDVDQCSKKGDRYSDIAACVDGCYGVDVTQDKNACLQEQTCNLDCASLQQSTNAQTDNKEDDTFTQYSSNAKQPSVTYKGKKYDETLQAPTGVGFKVQWALEEQGSSPAVETAAGDIVVGTTTGDLLCVNIGGIEKWRFASRGLFKAAPIIGANGDVYAGDTYGTLYRLNQQTGEVIQSWNLGGGIYAAPVVASDYVYAISRGSIGTPSVLHKLAISNGRGTMPWRSPVCTNDPLILDWARDGLTLTNDGVLVPCIWQGFLEKYDSRTGEPRWKTKLGTSAQAFGTPILASAPTLDSKGDIYIAHNSNKVAKVNPATGGIDWDTTIDAEYLSGSIAIDKNHGYVSTDKGIVSVIVLPTGTIASQKTVTDSSKHSVILDKNGMLVIPGYDEIVVVQSDNLLRHGAINVNGPISQQPIIAQGRIYVSTENSAISQLAVSAVNDVPTPQPTRATIVPTSKPTVVPTTSPPRAGAEKNNEWPTSAIVSACVLGGIFLFLIGALIYRRSKKKPQVEEMKPLQNTQPDVPLEENEPLQNISIAA